MNRILEMIEKRNQAWNAAKAFVESRRDKDGLLSDAEIKATKKAIAKAEAEARLTKLKEEL